MRFGSRAGWGVLIALSLAGCGDRQGSIDAAMALAEINYPRQLELYDTYLQKDHYDVVLAIKGDPVTRIRFGVDRDPAKCRPETRCEERLREAYETAIVAGAKLKALDKALRECGVTALGIDDTHITPGFRTIVELDLDPADQQPALARLTPCIAAFRQALKPEASAAERSLALRILRPSDRAKTVENAPLTFETRLARGRRDEPSFLAVIGPAEESLTAQKIRLNPHHLKGGTLRDDLIHAARRTLDGDLRGGHVPQLSFPWKTRLDPQRLDVIRTYILACSRYEPGSGPCKTDIAVRMRYDLESREISELAVLRDIADERGMLQLPELPGR